MSVTVSDCIIFSGTFYHLNTEKRTDCIDFPTGAYLREIRIIPSEIEVKKLQIKGHTTPNNFLVELHVFDISTREFLLVNTLQYDQISTCVSSIDYKMPTTTLVLRGNYKNISLVVIGLPSPQFPRELRLNPNDSSMIEGNDSLGFPNGIADDVLKGLILFVDDEEVQPDQKKTKVEFSLFNPYSEPLCCPLMEDQTLVSDKEVEEFVNLLCFDSTVDHITFGKILKFDVPSILRTLKTSDESAFEACITAMIEWIALVFASPSTDCSLKLAFSMIDKCARVEEFSVRLLQSNFLENLIGNITSLTTTIKIQFILSLLTLLSSAEAFEVVIGKSSVSPLQCLLDIVMQFVKSSIMMKTVIQVLLNKFEVYSAVKSISGSLGIRRDENEVSDGVRDNLRFLTRIYARDLSHRESETLNVICSPKTYYFSAYVDSVDLIHQLLKEFDILEKLSYLVSQVYSYDQGHNIIGCNYDFLDIISRNYEGLIFLLTNPSVLNAVDIFGKLSVCLVATNFEFSYTTLLFRLHAVCFIEKLKKMNSDGDLPSLADLVEKILYLGCHPVGRKAIVDVFEMPNSVDSIIRLSERIFENDDTLPDQGCSKLVIRLLFNLVEYTTSARFLVTLISRLLPILRQNEDETFSTLREILEQLSKIDLNLEECMTEVVYSIGMHKLNLSQQPFGLICVLRICCDLTSRRNNETDQQTFSRLSYVLNFMAADGFRSIFDLLENILTQSEPMWLCFVPTVEVMTYYLNIISLCLKIVRNLLLAISECDYSFRDSFVFNPILRCASLIFYLPSDSEHRNEIFSAILDSFSVFAHGDKKCVDYECMWSTMLSQIFEHMLYSPEYYLPTLNLLSMLMPAEFSEGQEMSRFGWEKHLLMIKPEIRRMLNSFGISSSVGIRNSLQRILRQLMCMGPEMGAFVTRSLVSLVCDFVSENDEMVSRGDQTMNLCCVLALELFVAIVGKTEIGMCCFSSLLLNSHESGFFESFLFSLIRLVESTSRNELLTLLGKRLVITLFEDICSHSKSSKIMGDLIPLFIKSKFGRICQALFIHIFTSSHSFVDMAVHTMELLIVRGHVNVICSSLDALTSLEKDFQDFVNVCLEKSKIELLSSVVHVISLLFHNCQSNPDLNSKVCTSFGFTIDGLNELCGRIELEAGIVITLDYVTITEQSSNIECITSEGRPCYSFYDFSNAKITEPTKMGQIYEMMGESSENQTTPKSYTPIRIKEGSFTVDKAIIKDNFEMLEKVLHNESLISCVDNFSADQLHLRREQCVVYDTSGQSRGIKAYVAPMRGKRIGGRGISLAAARSSNSSRFASLHIDEFKRLTGAVNENHSNSLPPEQLDQESMSYLTNFISGNE